MRPIYVMGIAAAIMMGLFALIPLNLFGSSITCAPNSVPRGVGKDEVLKLCGKPSSINHTDGYEQWVYGLGRYIYIDNGRFNGEQWTE